VGNGIAVAHLATPSRSCSGFAKASAKLVMVGTALAPLPTLRMRVTPAPACAKPKRLRFGEGRKAGIQESQNAVLVALDSGLRRNDEFRASYPRVPNPPYPDLTSSF
jgi:hypothetical protein